MTSAVTWSELVMLTVLRLIIASKSTTLNKMVPFTIPKDMYDKCNLKKYVSWFVWLMDIFLKQSLYRVLNEGRNPINSRQCPKCKKKIVTFVACFLLRAIVEVHRTAPVQRRQRDVMVLWSVTKAITKVCASGIVIPRCLV